jgi:hypothetical protein
MTGSAGWMVKANRPNAEGSSAHTVAINMVR